MADSFAPVTERMPLTAIGIAICAVVIFVFVPRQLCACSHGRSKDALALDQADHLAAHAAEVWTRDRSCPPLLVDDVSDPWGSRFRIACGDAGAAITSAGADGRFGTPDDIAARRR